MKIYKSKDRILQAVLAEIHKSAQKPDKGFMTSEQWAKRWGYVTNKRSQTNLLLKKGVESGLLEKRNYRIVTHGRLMMMAHYGPKSKSLTRRKS